MVLLIAGGCSNESTPTGTSGQITLQSTSSGLAELITGQTTTLDIDGVQQGIRMQVDSVGNVAASVPQVPPGTWTFRINYYGGPKNVMVAQAVGTATIVAGANPPVQLDALKYNFDDDRDGATNLQEVIYGFDPSPPFGNTQTPRLAVSVKAGAFYSLIHTNDGTVFSVGDQYYATLGREGGDTGRPSTVTDTDGNPNHSLGGITAIAAGYYHDLALQNDGTAPLRALGWGRDDLAQLCVSSGSLPGGAYAIAQNLNKDNLQAVAAGGDHSLFLKKDGTVFQCGSRDGFSSITGPVPGPGGTGVLSGVVAVAEGKSHSLVIIGDTVWAWGTNSEGELGNNSTAPSEVPVQVKGPGGAGVLTGIKAVAAGSQYSLAVASDGTVWHWGSLDKKCERDAQGQIVITSAGSGNSVISKQSTPMQVKGSGGAPVLTGIAAVAAGVQYVLALGNDGKVWSWGDGHTCQLGDNTQSCAFRNTPVRVQGPGGKGDLDHIVDLAAGCGHSLALKNDGTVWAWGRNDLVQLGVGVPAGPPVKEPTPVSKDFMAIVPP